MAEKVSAALKVYDSLEKMYKDNWKLSIYALDPAFHIKVKQIKDHLKATKTYRDDNYFIDPKSWTIEK